MRRTLVVGFVALALAGVWVLRAEFMARPEPVPDDSSLQMTIVSETRTPEDRIDDLTRAQVDLCVAESAPRVAITRLERMAVGNVDDDGATQAYHVVTQPGLGPAERDQIHGCLEDLRVRHLRMEVTVMELVLDGEVLERTTS